MKLELVILGITAFLVVNTYYDGKYTKLFQVNKKYLKIAIFAFVGFSLFLLARYKPDQSKGLLKHANDLIRYMPIDKNTADMLTPIFDLTKHGSSLIGKEHNPTGQDASRIPRGHMKRMLNSGTGTTKRSVSETKKKYVAAEQDWKCARCQEQLKATFEIDHKRDLRYGGTNHISNLEALCRNCHGNKTMLSNL